MPRSKKSAIPRYPHLDAPIGKREAEALVQSPESVSSHSFLPLLSYHVKYVPYKNLGTGKPPKCRSIRYAARRDSFIFSRYRSKLEPLYEKKLEALELGSNVLAYRRIPLAGKSRNKSNIHFARDAFEKLKSMSPCYAVCLDIKSFFDSVDHQYLRRAWCSLLGTDRLPCDHFAVFRAVTSYAYVEKMDVLKALGLIGPKVDTCGNSRIGFTKHWDDMPIQLCDPKVYRQVVKPLVQRHTEKYGIPQGIPMSDILSNLYLLEFDTHVKSYVSSLGGEYFRYSDDILILLPMASDPQVVRDHLIDEIEKTGPQMKIAADKCSVHFSRHDPVADRLFINQVSPMSQRDGLEYLGYRYDGRKIFIRSSTLSRLHRKVIMSIRSHVKKLIASNPKASLTELMGLLNVDLIHGRFGRRPEDVERGTFYSYAKRSQEEHGTLGSGAVSQVRRLKRFVRWRADLELTEIYKRHHAP